MINEYLIEELLNGDREKFFISQEKDKNGNWIDDDFTERFFNEVEIINSQSDDWLIYELPVKRIIQNNKVNFLRHFRIIIKD